MAAWPDDIDVDDFGLAKAEVEARIACRVVTGLAHSCLCLHFSAVVNQHARPDGASVRLHAFKKNLDPVLLAGDIIAEQGWRLIHVDDHNVNVAVVVEISKGTSSPRVGLNIPGPASAPSSSKVPLPRFLNKNAWSLVGRVGQYTLNFGVHIPCGDKDVWIPIVVEVGKAGTPTDKAGFDPNFRSARAIVEIALAIVAEDACKYRP